MLFELRDKEKSYDRGNKRRLGPTPPPRSAHNPRKKDDIPPKPNRPLPFIFNWSHEITPKHDKDWTLSDDREKELCLREERNEMIKNQLLLGRPVIYRSSGSSLYPRNWPNDASIEQHSVAQPVHL